MVSIYSAIIKATGLLSAAFVVQSAKNRERDFTRGNPVAFIIAGLIFTILFVLTIIGVVNMAVA